MRPYVPLECRACVERHPTPRPAAPAALRGIALLILFLCGPSAIADALARARQGQSMEELVEALDSSDEAVRQAAIEALAAQGKRAAKPLRGVLLSENFSRRSKAGVIEVWGKKKREGTKLLEEELLRFHTSSFPLKSVILSAIMDLGPKAAWTSPTLVELVESKPDRSFEEAHRLLRGGAIMALGRLGLATKKIRSTLSKQLKDSSLDIRLSATCALWWTGSDPAEVLPIFQEGLKSGDKARTERAIFGLGEMGPKAESFLSELEALRESSVAETRFAIDEAVGKIKGLLPPVGPRPFEAK